MPRSNRSLRVTNAYRDRLIALTARAARDAERTWPRIENFDDSRWPEVMERAVTRAQVEASRLSAAYVTAFVSSELGRRVPTATVDTRRYAGLTRGGEPIRKLLDNVFIGVKVDLKSAFGASSHLEEVTPEKAARWLAGGTHGGLDAAKVNELASKMARGEWDASTGSIRIARDGFTLDGQHRLTAVVQFGSPVEMLVADNLPNPLERGLSRAKRNIDLEVMETSRRALTALMESDDRVEGWQRSVKGTCGACMGDIAVTVSVQLPSIPLNVHPNCKCVTQPVVVGVPQTIALLTGAERLREMTDAEQDESFGPLAAARLRDGEIGLQDLVGDSHLDSDADNFLTQAPVAATT